MRHEILKNVRRREEYRACPILLSTAAGKDLGNSYIKISVPAGLKEREADSRELRR